MYVSSRRAGHGRGMAGLSAEAAAAPDQLTPLRCSAANVRFPQKRPFRFRFHATTVLMTGGGWNADLTASRYRGRFRFAIRYRILPSPKPASAAKLGQSGLKK